MGTRYLSRCVFGIGLVLEGVPAGAAYADANETAMIIHGALDREHGNVVQLSGCSGTYLGAGLVLTAAHCVPAPSSGRGVSVTYGDETSGRAPDDSSSNIMSLPDSMGEPRDITNDLAAIVFDNCKVPAGLAGMPLLGVATPLTDRDVGTTLLTVGYGATTAPTNEHPDGTGFGTRHRASVKLDALSSYTARVRPTDSKAISCPGDSGGPLLVSRGGTEYLAGVVSEGNCQTRTYYTRVDVQRNADFIAQAASIALLSQHSCTEEDRDTPGPGPLHCGAGGSPRGWLLIALAVWFAVRRRGGIDRRRRWTGATASRPA
jgi:V8-like Glu-specific endopeptidase